MGTEGTHWRTGTWGVTWSTRWAAVSAMRLAAKEGHGRAGTDLPAHEQSRGGPWRRPGHGPPGRRPDHERGIRPVSPHGLRHARPHEVPRQRGRRRERRAPLGRLRTHLRSRSHPRLRGHADDPEHHVALRGTRREGPGHPLRAPEKDCIDGHLPFPFSLLLPQRDGGVHPTRSPGRDPRRQGGRGQENKAGAG